MLAYSRIADKKSGNLATRVKVEFGHFPKDICDSQDVNFIFFSFDTLCLLLPSSIFSADCLKC